MSVLPKMRYRIQSIPINTPTEVFLKPDKEVTIHISFIDLLCRNTHIGSKTNEEQKNNKHNPWGQVEMQLGIAHWVTAIGDAFS